MEWISVKDRLPEAPCIFYWSDKRITVIEVDDGGNNSTQEEPNDGIGKPCVVRWNGNKHHRSTEQRREYNQVRGQHIAKGALLTEWK